MAILPPPLISSSNGHHPSSSNGFNPNGAGVSVENGGKKREVDAMQYEGEDGFVPLFEGSNLDRREFVRLALQAFEDMGYRCVSTLPSFRNREVLTRKRTVQPLKHFKRRAGLRWRIRRWGSFDRLYSEDSGTMSSGCWGSYRSRAGER
jgi:hypothetical protein